MCSVYRVSVKDKYINFLEITIRNSQRQRVIMLSGTKTNDIYLQGLSWIQDVVKILHNLRTYVKVDNICRGRVVAELVFTTLWQFSKVYSLVEDVYSYKHSNLSFLVKNTIFFLKY